MPSRALIVYTIAFLLSALPARALHFHVDGTPAGNGDDRRSVQSAQNPDTPFRTISHALRIAHLVPQGRPHVISIAAGTYAPSTNGESFPLLITQTGIHLEASGLTTFDAEGRSNLLQITAPTSDFIIKGIDFRNGRAARGGAAYCESCSLRVVDSRFFSNQATEGGHALYVKNGRVKFFSNVLSNNGSAESTVPVLELHDTFADTSQRDIIRNNTFYRNPSPNILSSGNRTDIDSNTFLDPEQAAIVDSSQSADPLMRYNMFWETEILYISDKSDSIKVLRTVRDTLTLEEQHVFVPSFVTNTPDTLAKVGDAYRYSIEVGGNRNAYIFNPFTLPSGVSSQQVAEQGVINWTPALADTGRSEVRVEINTPAGAVDFLQYNIHVFTAEDFPDTASQEGPQIEISFQPDTTGAAADLNALLPVFSPAASAGGNQYLNPAFLDTTINRFELVTGSPAIDKGNPIVALYDAPGRRTSQNDGERNNVGNFGGPDNSGVPLPDTSFSEVEITNLPDSVAVEGQPFTYDPVLLPGLKIDLIDLIDDGSGPQTMDPFRTFSKPPPITWMPTIADTGSYLIGVTVYTPRGEGRHYFPLRVRPSNQIPVVNSAPDTVALEDIPYAYTIQASDADGDTLSYALISGPEGMSVDAQSGLIQWAPTQENLGATQVEIRIDDGKGASTLHSFSLAVLNTNDDPLITSLPDTVAIEDSLYTYALTVTDADPGDSLSYALVSSPDSMKVDSAGVLTWTPLQADVGAHQITVHALDDSSGIGAQSFLLTVLQVDDPPQISSQPDTLASEDQLYHYVLVAADEEGAALTYLLETAPQAMQIDSAGVLEWTPTSADTGLQAVVVQVTDPAGQTAVQSFSLRVLEVNDPPQITAFNPVDTLVQTLPGALLPFSVEASDEEGDSLAFSWRLNGTLQVGASSANLSYTPSLTLIDTLTVIVADRTDSAAFSWIVDGRQIPRISVAADSDDFGAVAIGDTAQVDLSVANEGSGDLNITDLLVGDLPFAALFTAAIVPAGETTTLQLRYMPTDRGLRERAVTFATDDPDRQAVQIPLVGLGVVPTRLALDLDPTAGSQNLRELDLAPDQEITLAIYAERALDLIGYEAWLIYDSTALKYTSFAAGGESEASLLNQEGVIPVAIPSDSLLQVRVTAPQGATGASGDGLLGLISLVLNSSFTGEQTEIRLSRALLSSAGIQAPDTLLPDLTVLLRPQLLVGDFNKDRVVDFDDFFLFADHFGTTPDSPNWDSLYSLDGDDDVDFDDFFLFADHFGEAAGKLLFPPAAVAAAPLRLEAANLTADQVEFEVYWQGEQSVRGYVVGLDFDAEILRFEEFRSPASTRPLRWVVEDRPGHLTVAAGLAADQQDFHSGDLGTLLFARLSPEETALSPTGALSWTSGRTALLAAPPQIQLASLPQTYLLYPPYPNPFNPETALSFYLPRKSPVKLRIYDLLGRPVRTLVGGELSSGYHTFTWKGRDQAGRPVAAGLYLVELQAADFRQVHKLMLLK